MHFLFTIQGLTSFVFSIVDLAADVIELALDHGECDRIWSAYNEEDSDEKDEAGMEEEFLGPLSPEV